jgi:hypothetical protein
MAFTLTRTKTVFGNEGVEHIKVLADGAEATIQTSLRRVDAFALGYISMTAIGYTIHPNVGSTATAALGSLGVSGLTSGDEFYITVFGPR